MSYNTVGKTDITQLWDSIKESIGGFATDPQTTPYTTLNTLVDDFKNNKISMDQFRTDFENIYSSLESEDATIIEPLLTAIGLRELEEDVGNPNFADGITNTDSMGITFASLKTELISKSDILDNGELTSTAAAQELFGIIAEHVRNEDVIATNPETKANLLADEGSLKAAFDSFIVKKNYKMVLEVYH